MQKRCNGAKRNGIFLWGTERNVYESVGWKMGEGFVFQRVRRVWLKWRRKTKRLHRLTFGLLLGLVEAPVVYMGLTGGLYCVSVGGWCCVVVGLNGGWVHFFYADFEICYCEIIPYNNYMVYLHWILMNCYGKGNTCASAAQYRWIEAERLVL